MIKKLAEYLTEEILQEPDLVLESDEDLLSTGLVDSMGIVRYIAWISDEFDIEIPTEDMVIDNFISLSAISRYITSRQG